MIKGISLLVFLVGSFTFAKQIERAPSQACIRSPMVTCREEFHIAKNENGCFVCVADNDEESDVNCVTKPTILCKKGYEISKTAVGCFVCVPKKWEAKCIKKPLVTCGTGTHIAKNKEGCFFCIKDQEINPEQNSGE